MEGALPGHVTQGIRRRPVDVPPPSQLAPTPFGCDHDAGPDIGSYFGSKRTPPASIFHNDDVAMRYGPVCRIFRVDFQKQLPFTLQQSGLIGEGGGDEMVRRTGNEIEAPLRCVATIQWLSVLGTVVIGSYYLARFNGGRGMQLGQVLGDRRGLVRHRRIPAPSARPAARSRLPT